MNWNNWYVLIVYNVKKIKYKNENKSDVFNYWIVLKEVGMLILILKEMKFEWNRILCF